MADYAFPNSSGFIIPEMGSYWGLQANTQMFQSPLNGAIQTGELPGAYWRCGIRLMYASVAESAALQAWLVKLRGQANRALIHQFERPRPRGTIAGSPALTTGVQTGTTIIMNGITVGTTLLAGDYIGINQGLATAQLLMVTDAASANGSGVMSCSVYPEIRSAPLSGSSVVTSGPRARFILASPAIQWSPRNVGQADFNLDFIESVPL